ncbi:AfsR/SARP family transcriptional regulator [Streptomyces sp. 3211]|uniref:AfsR/SARP family transcriptional regulator n=1 Tax=Streptomyces sp. 3211 TaxID=1964449 RepID=UPI0009A48D77|nr:AfsR/SARP family transcriptional regulator [Streptomyces sp. 3211]
MRIQLLGPLGAEINGNSVLPTARKPRQLLALLALHPGRLLPAGTLIEEIWGTDPPPGAPATLQTYILQLRRHLHTALTTDTATGAGAGTGTGAGTGGGRPRAAKDVLTGRHGGYLLRIPAPSVDVHTYESLLAHGHRSYEQGDDHSAATALRTALALWQGPALVDVTTGPILRIEVLRLQESRLGTTERRIDMDLRLGRHTQLLAELTELTARHPRHEPLHAQAMVALYRSGRQARALDVYRRLRTRLIEDLAVEPSPPLQRLHQAVLNVDPALTVRAGPRRTSTFDLYAR